MHPFAIDKKKQISEAVASFMEAVKKPPVVITGIDEENMQRIKQACETGATIEMELPAPDPNKKPSIFAPR